MAGADDIVRLRRLMLVKVPVGLGALLAVWLVAAGTPRYWQAWMVTGTFLVLVVSVGAFFLRTDPDFLTHRLQYREKEAAQRRIISGTTVFVAGWMLLPGFDARFGWSRVPALICLAGLALMLGAYAVVLWVFRTNRYASRIVEVQPGQTVIAAGPYAIVRHPMYASQIVMFPALMIALGSWWGAALGVLIAIPLALRLRNEEEVLRRDLPGYDEYCRRVRYRLVPGIW